MSDDPAPGAIGAPRKASNNLPRHPSHDLFRVRQVQTLQSYTTLQDEVACVGLSPWSACGAKRTFAEIDLNGGGRGTWGIYTPLGPDDFGRKEPAEALEKAYRSGAGLALDLATSVNDALAEE